MRAYSWLQDSINSVYIALLLTFSSLVTTIFESVLLDTILSAPNEEFSLLFIALKKRVPRMWRSSVSSHCYSHFLLDSNFRLSS